MDYFITPAVFFLGAAIGSFLNVCIHRLPINKSVVSPPSSCPGCGTRIRFYDNIPIISYLILRGRCRSCGNKISPRYPLVELISGLMALATWIYFGLTVSAIVYFIFICALIVITFIDVDHRIIPNKITLPGIPIAFLTSSFLLPEMTPLQALIGLLAGGGSLYVVGLIYSLLTGQEGMGGGDVKLLAMIGALTGIKGVILTVLLSSVIGTLAGLILMAAKGKKDLKFAVPFGPFLALGSIIHIFFGNQLILWYLGFMR